MHLHSLTTQTQSHINYSINKRFTLLLLSLAFTLGCASAQVTLIPKAGVTFSSYTFERFPEQRNEETYNPGIVAGVALNLPSTKLPWLSIQPEINYLQKKHSYQTFATLPFYPEAEISFMEQKKTLSYLEVPILVKATLQNGKWYGYLNAGPSVSYAIAGKFETGDDKSEYNFSQSNRLEFSVQGGGGLGFTLGGGTLLLDARFSLGLTHLDKEYTGPITINIPGEEAWTPTIHLDADQKSRVLSFTVGYAFPLSAIASK
ncbi:porin family protein [Rufibacter hautae]|uniref:PorT family protein n=1 Tax=Rufibacter hautae TaxID=2595005 RepID=A0A5B6TJ87_9BACT|nr:porin family protein [Rufibacter hautae]KAA3439425.1 PorT family protein [Rufibacter hautae]